MYEYWRKNESKSLVLALLAILKNIYEFWRKKRKLAKKLIKFPRPQKCERHEYCRILAKKII